MMPRQRLVILGIVLVCLAALAVWQWPRIRDLQGGPGAGRATAPATTPTGVIGSPTGSSSNITNDTSSDDRSSLAGGDASVDSLYARLRAEGPTRDAVDLAVRMGRAKAPVHRTRQAPPRVLHVGDVESFWLHDIETERYMHVQAKLEAISRNAYFWVQEGQHFDRQQLEQGAHAFGDEVMPKVRAVFGTEWSPGVDGDPRVHVLHHQPTGGVAGYFSSTDEYTIDVEPHSNEKELFNINLNVYTPGSYDYLALLAHEFQHMIHWHMDPDESVWANEGLSELAPLVAGYQQQTGVAFLNDPDTPLLEWETEPQANGSHYAGAFLFFAYLRARYGDDAIRQFVAAPANGPNGVEAALKTIGRPASFEATYLDWAVANLVHNGLTRDRQQRSGAYPAPGSTIAADTGAGYAPPTDLDPRYSYGGLNVKDVVPDELPKSGTGATVGQFATDYLDATRLVTDGQLHLRFAGDPTVALLEARSPVSGTVWWSGRGENMDSRLTRQFDLRRAKGAKLTFRMYYDLETNWDYAYFLASTDGGQSWARLATDRTTEDNPNGNSYGAALTGEGGWVDEAVDLSAYDGQEVLVRFEVLTDDAVSLEGLAVDDMHLDSVGFRDDAESAASDALWQAEGFRRVPPVLPQRWGVQVVVQRPDGLSAQRVPVRADGAGEVDVTGIPGDAVVTLVVSGLTPGTRAGAGYRVQVGR